VTPPVLLAHGFASSFELNWREPGFADLLADMGREVIPFDFPGHGTAEKSHDPADYADLAGHLERALPADGQVDLVGFSLGGLMSLRVAARHPERIRRLVVAGVGENVFRKAGSDVMADALESGGAPDDEVLMNLFVNFSQAPGNDPKALAACMRRDEEPLTPDDLAKVTMPTLVVIGDKDQVGPAEPLVEALPDARLVVLKGTEHFGTPRAFPFWDAALDFLAEA
jgi:pimeloyl-ACP methyl ester carboxylesterase